MNKTVYLMSYDHGGYVFWKDRFYEKLLEAEELLRKYPHFKIGLDNESFAYEEFDKTDPKVVEKIKSMLKEFKGRFSIGATTYGQPLSAFVCEESNYRQLTYAIKTNLEIFGVTPPVYAISEHALHSQLPQLLNQVGFKQAIIRTHFMMYGYNPTIDAPYCDWIGDDGSSIPAVPTYDGEGAQFGKTTVDNWFLTRWPDVTDESPENFVRQFNHIEPLLASRYDDLDLRCEKMIAHTVENQQYKWVLLEDLEGIYANIPKMQFVTKPNDFILRMPWGYCGGKLMRLARQCENNCVVSERCDAAAFMLAGNSMQEDMEAAWKNALIMQHHDIQICGLVDETEYFADKSMAASQAVINHSMNVIANAFNRGDNSVVVFNPLDRAVTVPVKARIQFGLKNKGTGFKAVCGDEVIECEFDYEQQRRQECICATVYFAAILKPFSAKCYDIVPDNGVSLLPMEQKENTIETDNYVIDLDDFGIKSIYSKKFNRYISKADKGMLFKGIIDDKEEESYGRWHIYPYNQFVIAEHIGSIGAITYKFTMTVHNTLDRIECDVTFSHHGEKIGIAGKYEFLDDTNGFIHEHKLRFALPVTSDNNGCRDMPYVISKTDDKYLQGNYWTGIEGEVAYLNKGSMCAVREETCFSLPLEYSNDYVWGKRILFGEYEHSFAIMPYEDTTTVHLEAYEYNHQPVTYVADKGEGKYNGEIIFLNHQISKNLLTTAIYIENNKLVMRVYETEGKLAQMNVNDKSVNFCGKEVKTVDFIKKM